MKNCKCGNRIPSTIILDGKKRNLHSRKRCFECSPWGMRNRIPEDARRRGDNFICSVCEREFSLDRSKGHRSRICVNCSIKTRKVRMRQRALEYAGGKCCRCGYNKCKAALTFHHIDEDTKLFTISGSYNRAWNSLKIEIDKCILICANCHAEEHYGY